jgi:hypothetical protein
MAIMEGNLAGASQRVPAGQVRHRPQDLGGPANTAFSHNKLSKALTAIALLIAYPIIAYQSRSRSRLILPA